MRNSKIEWTDDTDNIIVVKGGGWWCRKVKGSRACDNCYAEEVNDNEFFGGNHLKYQGKPPELELRRDILARWKRQTKPRKHFVMSLSDIFGEWVPRSWQFEFLDAMLEAPLQTFQLLTKRTHVALFAIKRWMAARGLTSAPSNIWFGFTAEDQEHFDQRWRFAKQLAELGFTIFVSLEPLLGSIVLPADFLALGKRAQVIVGGESGKKARPTHPDWVRALRDQCIAAGVRFFFKQWGEFRPAGSVGEATNYPILVAGPENRSTVMSQCYHLNHQIAAYLDGAELSKAQCAMARVGKKAAGRLLDGEVWSQFPEVKAA